MLNPTAHSSARNSNLRASLVITCFLVITVATAVSSAQEKADLGTRQSAAQSHFFTFYSHFGFNLYDALLTSGTARLAEREEPLSTDAKECFDALSREQRSAWNAAVDYFATNVASTHDFSPERDLFRGHLNGFGIPKPEQEDALALGLLFLRAAAPAYRTCYWPRQDRLNREWIEGLLPRLESHGTKIAARLQRFFGVEWKKLPITVDVVETVGWSGADTITRPVTHIQISSRNRGYQDLAALEMVFHEASHELVSPRRGPIADALSRAVDKVGTKMHRSLWHGVLFVTVGEVTRAVLEDAGKPGYVPYAEAQNVFRNNWQPMLEPLRKSWIPHVRGASDRETAAKAVVEALASGSSE